MIEITAENFEQEVLKSDKIAVVDFYANWCMPCKMMKPVLENISDEFENLKVCKVDIDENETLAQQFNIM